MTLPPETTPPARTTPQHNLASAMEAAAKQVFSPYERRPRKPWISDHTLALLEQAKKAEAAQTEDAKSKRNAAKRAARKDRINWIHAQLEADPSATKAAWTTARGQKKVFRRRAKTSSCGR